MKKSLINKFKYGFTVAELTLVVFIISVVMVSALPTITKKQKPSSDADIIPTGTIILWYGDPYNTAKIPSGYHVCDGSPGTPDLRNRFIISAGSTHALGASSPATWDAASYAIGASYSLTNKDTQMPAHTHTMTIANTTDSHTHTINSNPSNTHSDDFPSRATTDTGSHSHTGFTMTPLQVAVGYPLLNDTVLRWYSNRYTTASTVQHVIHFSNVPNHDHGGSATSDSVTHTHNYSTNNVGASQAFGTLPPYYVLCYIIKIS